MSPQIKSVCDRVIRDMASMLLLEPVVDIANQAACEARWRQQRIANIAIQEFGPEAKAIAQAELHRLAGGPELSVPSLVRVSVPMNGRRDGVRTSGKPDGGRDAA